MRPLISGRIYEIPTGERLVALPVVDSYWFYNPATRFHEPRKYSTDPTGRIINARTSQPTAWTVDDLVDTGEDLSA